MDSQVCGLEKQHSNEYNISNHIADAFLCGIGDGSGV